MTLQGIASDTEPLAISHSALTGWEYYRFLIKLLNMTLTVSQDAQRRVVV
jgi:hypothetical protein